MTSALGSKKFRFDSFATEFGNGDDVDKDSVHATSIAADNDSGIDSEEIQVSPPLSTTSSPTEPLSLVVDKSKSTDEEETRRRRPTAVRHWKKCLKDQADPREEAEDLSMQPPAKRVKAEPRPATPMKVKEEPQEAPASPRVSVAKALLTLSQTTSSPNQPLNLHRKKVSSHSNLPPLVPQCAPLRPIPLPATAQTPLRPLQSSQIPNRIPPPPPYSAHPLPWIHRPTPLTTIRQTQQQQQNEPENLSVRLPQHPVALCASPAAQQQQQQHRSAFLQLQSPTLSSTCRSPLAINPQPLREIQGNGQLRLSLPQEPVPRFAPLPSTPHFLPLPSPSSVSSLSPSENNFVHPHPPPSMQESKKASKKSKANKPFSCTECRKAFSTQSGFDKHKQLHCNNQIPRSFSCKYCNKGYTSLSALKMHIRTHTLPCRCETCGKSFSRPWLLQGHVRTHTGEKPFSCDYCSRSFADKSNLRAHLQTHLQTKKYSCPGCKKTFSRMSLLNKHTDSGTCPHQQQQQQQQSRTVGEQECVQTLVGLSTSNVVHQHHHQMPTGLIRT